MYGQVKYFIPEWSSSNYQNIDKQLEHMNYDIINIQNELPNRYFTVGRKLKANNTKSGASQAQPQ